MSLVVAIGIFQAAVVRGGEPQLLQSMVIVTGDHGRGSAFVVAMDGRTYLVTNSHVIQGNTNVKFKTLGNQELRTGPLQIADKADLVRAEVEGTTPALKIATHLEQKLKIGEAIVVSGNSEGEGVVREIPGKLVGIGPDRIEVDANFVSGNSGSPILMESTGSVIGVATYMTMPPALKKGEKSPTSLNEVRRFGYRLDTVGTWITPENPDRLEQEGLKLERMDETMHLVISILDSTISDLMRGSNAYVNKEQVASNPGIAALAVAIDDFAERIRSTKQSTKARLAESGRQYVTKLFEALRTATVNDVRGFKEENFSGYYAILFKEHLDRRRNLYAWLDDTHSITIGSVGMPAKPAARPSATKLPSKWGYYRDPTSTTAMGELTLKDDGTLVLTGSKGNNEGTWKLADPDVIDITLTKDGKQLEPPGKIRIKGKEAVWERSIGERYLRAKE